MSVKRGELVRIVAGREIDVSLHGKGFLTFTVVFIAGIVASIASPAMLASGGADERGSRRGRWSPAWRARGKS